MAPLKLKRDSYIHIEVYIKEMEILGFPNG
jgi:hypothetical protein